MGLHRMRKRIKRKKSLADPWRYFDKRYKIPINISKVSSTMIRRLHSYWSAQYVYAQSMVADREANVRQIKSDRKRLFNDKYIERKRIRETNELARIRAENNSEVLELDKQIDILEIQLTVWNSLTESCRTFMYLCSRDQSWRQVEMDSYMNRGNKVLG